MDVERSRDGTEHGLSDVVVGIDGSAASITALRWAADAVSPSGRIHAVHVLVPAEELAVDAAQGDSVRLRHRREEQLRDVWVPAAVGVERGSVVEWSVREGHVAAELLRLAAESGAEALVVGHHARPHLGPQLVGHVTAAALRDADRPVVVVPLDWSPERTEGRPVVVGVGVSKGTRSAIRWVMEHPRLCRSGMILAHALGPRTLFRNDGWLDVLAYHLDPTVLPTWVEEDLLELADQLRRETGSDVDVAVSVQPGRTGARLVEAGEGAGLLVVGRGEPPFVRSRTIAPYLRHAIAHAPCPVVVVPAREE